MRMNWVGGLLSYSHVSKLYKLFTALYSYMRMLSGRLFTVRYFYASWAGGLLFELSRQLTVRYLYELSGWFTVLQCLYTIK